jgi:hypothetical protein
MENLKRCERHKGKELQCYKMSVDTINMPNNLCILSVLKISRFRNMQVEKQDFDKLFWSVLQRVQIDLEHLEH